MNVRNWKLRRGVAPLVVLAFLACGGSQAENAEGEASSDAGSEAISAESSALLSAGTAVTVTLDQELGIADAEVGQAVSATVTEPISSDGRVLVPVGSKVYGEVTAVQRVSESENDAAVLKVHFNELTADGELYPLDAEILEANPVMKSETSTGEAVAKVGAGTAAGAILGRIIGGDDTGTLVGAAVGAAAGTAIVLGTQEKTAVLPAGSNMRLRLLSPVRVTT